MLLLMFWPEHIPAYSFVTYVHLSVIPVAMDTTPVRHTRESVSLSVGTQFDSEASGSASRALGSALNAGCGKNGACGLRLPLPQDQPVEFGLKPTELLLRGGRLDHPLVLSDVRWADGKPFFDLHKDSKELCMLLARQKPYARPLSGRPLFEELKYVRNDWCMNAIRASKNLDRHEDAAGVLTAIDEKPIHGGEEPVSAGEKFVSHTNARHKRMSFWDLALLPKFHEIPFTTEGLDTIWSPLVLLEVGQKSVSIEATVANFDSLLTLFNFWVSTTCDDGPPTRTLKRQKSDSKIARGSPRSRIIHVHSKGFVKCRKEEPSPRESISVVASARAMPTSVRAVRKPRRWVKASSVPSDLAEVVLGTDDVHSFNEEF